MYEHEIVHLRSRVLALRGTRRGAGHAGAKAAAGPYFEVKLFA